MRITRSGPLRRVTLLLSLLGIVLLSWHLSQARTLWYDELLAWNLLTDPSWHHMIDSWNRGADSGGLLFYVIGRPLVLGLGRHVFPIRLASALGLWISAVLWWRMLPRRTSDLPAAFAVALVFLGNATLLNYVAEIRFYGLLILTTTLAVYAVHRIDQAKPSHAATFSLCLLTNALLLSSHMLGVLYSGALIAALVLSAFPRRLKLPAVLGSFASWSVLLLYRRAMDAGASKLNWIPMPPPIDLLRYYLHRPTAYRPLNAALFALMLSAAWVAWRDRRPPLRLSFVTTFSLLMLLAPLAFYVLSHTYKPIFAERYIMPYLLGFAYLLGRALETLAALNWSPLTRRTATVIAAACLVFVAVSSIRDQAVRPASDIAQLLSLSPSDPLVIPNDRLFLQARYQQGPVTRHVAYLTPPQTPAETNSSIMATLVTRGYARNVFTAPAFLAAHPHFVYLDLPRDTDLNTWTLTMDPTLRSTRIGTVEISHRAVPLLRVERP